MPLKRSRSARAAECHSSQQMTHLVELHPPAERATGGAFMRGVVAAFPDRILPVLTDNGVALTNGALTRWDRMVHGFDRVDVEYR